MIFNLFLTIFGLPYLIACKLQENADIKKSKLEMQNILNEESERKNRWVNRMTDQSLERKFGIDYDNKDHDTMIKLEDALNKLSLYNQLFYLPPTPELPRYDEEKRELALMILMAYEGRLTKRCASEGVYAGLARIGRPAAIELFFWIDDRLREHGICEEAASTNYTGYYRVEPLKRGDNQYVHYDYYVWKPMYKSIAKVTKL